MKRLIRYGLLGLWIYRLARTLPTQHTTDDMLIMFAFCTGFMFVISLLVGLSIGIAEAITGRSL